MDKTQVLPFNVIGLAVRTTNMNNQGAKDIGALFNRFLTENLMLAIPNRISDEIYSVYTDYESDYTGCYTTLLGCKVSSLLNIPEGMTGKKVVGGLYSHFIAKGDLGKGIVAKKWSEIWSPGIERAYTTDFEIYGVKAQNPTNAEVEIYIAL